MPATTASDILAGSHRSEAMPSTKSAMWSSWVLWAPTAQAQAEVPQVLDANIISTDGRDPLSEAHFASSRMMEFLLGSAAGDFSSAELWAWDDDNKVPNVSSDSSASLRRTRTRNSSVSSADSFDSYSSGNSDSEGDSMTSPQAFLQSPNIWTAPSLTLSKQYSAPTELSASANPFIPTFQPKPVAVESWAVPYISPNLSSPSSSSRLHGGHTLFQTMSTPGMFEGPTKMQQYSQSWSSPAGLALARKRSKATDRARPRFSGDAFDIDNGLCIPELGRMPFEAGRKVVRFFSKRTHRRTVVSVIDPKYLQPEVNHEGEFGFLTFHDCVELRTLKTGETLTRNQRNNLRKRLATTARTVVQVDVAQLLQDFSEPDCCPRSTYHHTKLNAYLISPAVSQVLLCTRESDLGDTYKGQTLAAQTLFDLCKNENASNALAEFIKSQPGIDLNTRDFKGMCPIHYAAKGGFKDGIDVLLRFNADVNVKDKSDQSPLHYAIYNGHRDVQFQLLMAGAAVDTRNVSGNTLLHVAAYHNQIEIAAAILQRSPELVHVRNHKFLSTPLECAVHKGLTEMARLLSGAS
eukprot:comp20023_c0_seq1/m.24572 comp20023_c0_seq1/g.24572  ORF comp20023_c0_seq1/g.24572 comp20023_c0_seq1/m.24572 type:complete len:577 (-) comp20023_c0_seq1:622-2352(-)